MKQIVEEIKT